MSWQKFPDADRVRAHGAAFPAPVRGGYWQWRGPYDDVLHLVVLSAGEHQKSLVLFHEVTLEQAWWLTHLNKIEWRPADAEGVPLP